MIEELQSLTNKHRRDRQLTRRNLTTRVSPTPGPYSEFKTFLSTGTRRQTVSTTDRPSGSPRDFVPTSSSRHKRQTSQEGRRSADRSATTESRHRDSDDDMVEGLGSLGIRSRHDSPPDQERGYGYNRARPAITEQSARHSSDRIITPEHDRDRGGGDFSPWTNVSRALSVLSDSSYDVLSTGSYDSVGARDQGQRDNNQQRQRSPINSSRPSDRHASFSQDSSRQRHAEADSISSRMERPPIANIAHRQTSAEAPKSRRDEGTVRPQGVDFFVPDEDVDIKVLATHLKEYVDPEASIKRSKHPKVSL